MARTDRGHFEPPIEGSATTWRSVPPDRVIRPLSFLQGDLGSIPLSLCLVAKSGRLRVPLAGKERKAAAKPPKIRSRIPIVELEMSRDVDWQSRGVRMQWHNASCHDQFRC